MEGLYKCSYSHAYAASGLFNLAWAQVQNKPLNEVLVEFKPENDSVGPQGGGGEEGGTKNWVVAASDDEREEGEVEEDETYLESESMEPDENRSLGGGFGENGMDDEEENRILSIRKMLDYVNPKEAAKSFDVACAHLRSYVENLQNLGWFPTKDALIQQFFGAFEYLKTEFSSMSALQKEQNKGAMLSLIAYAMGLRPALFSPEQMKEIETALLLISSSLDISQREKTSTELPVTHKPMLTDLYASDALRAFSSYQQKFNRSSFSSLDKLPSPTPSEEGNCGETDDANEEVSSFPHQTTLNSRKPSISPQLVVSPSSNESSGVNTGRIAGILGPVPQRRSKGTAKSRDPRLGRINPDQISLEGPTIKKNKKDGQHNCLKHEEGLPSVAARLWSEAHLLEGYNDQQRANIRKERARKIDEQRKLFSAHKLSLVLDLDHTLLNSAKLSEVDPIHDEFLRKREEQDRDKQHRHLFHFPHMGMWTKLRPGIWNFLEKANKLFELHLYTMGNKRYATEMAKVLDPKGTLFGGRVISGWGDESDDLLDVCDRVITNKTKDLEGVLGMESGILIIDDSVRVWPYNKSNLIVVERYMYFPSSRRQFGLPGLSLLEIDHDERPDEGTLASMLAVIERVHQNFFAQERLEDVDVRSILASERKKILAGCRILFSGFFHVGDANPHLHPLWKTAEQFGAVCTNQIDEQVTHVVTNLPGTEKVSWALCTGRFAVRPGWVEASALLFRRANELDFAVKP